LQTINLDNNNITKVLQEKVVGIVKRNQDVKHKLVLMTFEKNQINLQKIKNTSQENSIVLVKINDELSVYNEESQGLMPLDKTICDANFAQNFPSVDAGTSTLDLKKLKNQSQEIYKEIMSKSDADYEVAHIPASDLEIDNKLLGKGGCALVYKGKWKITNQISQEIVFKKRKEDNEYSKMQFIKEAKFTARINHPNIIKCYGICTDKNNYGLVIKYAPNGTLKNYLEKNPNLSWKDRGQMALKIAYGLKYLHNNRLIHHDLKDENILIDEQFNPQLSDLGFTKTDDPKDSLYSISTPFLKGTAGWLPPEACQNGGSYDYKSDVYSY
jgi:tRNA A-37 threonylcarbamoyl transferase component Bud32